MTRWRLWWLQRRAARLARLERDQRSTTSVTVTGGGTAIVANHVHGSLTITNGQIHIDDDDERARDD